MHQIKETAFRVAVPILELTRVLFPNHVCYKSIANHQKSSLVNPIIPSLMWINNKRHSYLKPVIFNDLFLYISQCLQKTGTYRTRHHSNMPYRHKWKNLK